MRRMALNWALSKSQRGENRSNTLEKDNFGICLWLADKKSSMVLVFLFDMIISC